MSTIEEETEESGYSCARDFIQIHNWNEIWQSNVQNELNSDFQLINLFNAQSENFDLMEMYGKNDIKSIRFNSYKRNRLNFHIFEMLVWLQAYQQRNSILKML